MNYTAPAQIHPWLTIAQAAEMLQVNEKTIRRRIAEGALEARRFGPTIVRINPDSLIASGRPMTSGRTW